MQRAQKIYFTQAGFMSVSKGKKNLFLYPNIVSHTRTSKWCSIMLWVYHVVFFLLIVKDIGFKHQHFSVLLTTASPHLVYWTLQVVTCGNLPLESSFQRVPRCVYTSTCLYEYRGWDSKAANTTHRRFTWGLRSMEVSLLEIQPWKMPDSCNSFHLNHFSRLFSSFAILAATCSGLLHLWFPVWAASTGQDRIWCTGHPICRWICCYWHKPRQQGHVTWIPEVAPWKESLKWWSDYAP